MHPIEVAIGYVIIALVLTVYLGRRRGSGSDLKPGDSFPIMKPVLVLAGVFFIGLPAMLIYWLPEAVHPVGATVMVVLISILFSTAFILLLGFRLEITEDGLSLYMYRWRSSCALIDYKSVSTARYNIILSPRDPAKRPFVFPAVFQDIGKIHDYVKSQIEGELAVAEKKQGGPSHMLEPTSDSAARRNSRVI